MTKKQLLKLIESLSVPDDADVFIVIDEKKVGANGVIKQELSSVACPDSGDKIVYTTQILIR